MSTWPILLAQNNNASDLAPLLFALICNCIIPLGFYALIAISLGKLFEKAGKPAWAGWVPIYNYYLVTEISGREILWFILLFIPCINIVAAVIICMDFAKAYGKDPAWGIGMALLPIVFIPILGFSDAKYQGAAPKQF